VVDLSVGCPGGDPDKDPSDSVAQWCLEGSDIYVYANTFYEVAFLRDLVNGLDIRSVAAAGT
jgi:hypothetical protein